MSPKTDRLSLSGSLRGHQVVAAHLEMRSQPRVSQGTETCFQIANSLLFTTMTFAGLEN